MNSMIAYHVIQDVKQDGKRSTEIIEKFDNSYTCEEIINILRKMNVRKVYDYGYIPNYTRTELTDALHDNAGFRTDNELTTPKAMAGIIRRSKGL